jgi:hypothetical protein
LAAATEQSEPGPGCTNVPKGPTVCRDGSTVSVGGKTDEAARPMKKAFENSSSIRSAKALTAFRKTSGAEHLGHEIGKLGQRIFGW